MKDNWGILLLAIGFGFAGCRQADDPPAVNFKKLKPVFGSQQVIDAIQSSTTAQAYRLAEESFYEQELSNYDRVGDSIEVAAADRVRLQKVLLDENSYELNSAKGCEPVFGVGLSFLTDKRTVDVLFCFQCDILVVYDNGKEVGGEDFDPVRPQLVAVMKNIFPGDEVIQQLK